MYAPKSGVFESREVEYPFRDRPHERNAMVGFEIETFEPKRTPGFRGFSTCSTIPDIYFSGAGMGHLRGVDLGG